MIGISTDKSIGVKTRVMIIEADNNLSLNKRVGLWVVEAEPDKETLRYRDIHMISIGSKTDISIRYKEIKMLKKAIDPVAEENAMRYKLCWVYKDSDFL